MIEKKVLGTKGPNVAPLGPTGWGFSFRIHGRPSYVQKALNSSLKRLDVDVIDLWLARGPRLFERATVAHSAGAT